MEEFLPPMTCHLVLNTIVNPLTIFVQSLRTTLEDIIKCLHFSELF